MKSIYIFFELPLYIHPYSFFDATKATEVAHGLLVAVTYEYNNEDIFCEAPQFPCPSPLSASTETQDAERFPFCLGGKSAQRVGRW